MNIKWIVTSAVIALLAACTGAQPPASDPFFAGQQPFGAAPPSDARVVTLEEFKSAAGREGFVWDSLKSRQERTAAARAQFALIETEIKRLSASSSGYRKALKPPPSDGSVKVLDDGNYLVTIAGRNGPKQVVTEGPRSYFQDLLESKKRFTTISNQVRVYGYGYKALPEALKAGLPTPESLTAANLETLLTARRELAKRLEANLDAVDDAKVLVSSVRPQGINPDAKPPNFPASPSLEQGFGTGGDRDQGCASATPDDGGLYKNFWWKQKFYATSVKDQGSRGTCPAFGLTGALETRIAIEQGRWVNLSEQRLWYQIAGIWEPRWYGDGANLVNRAEDFHEQGFKLPMEQTWNYNPSNSRKKNEENETYSKSCEDYDEFCSNSSFQGEHICTGPFCGYFPAAATGERFKESEPDVLFDFWDDAFGVPVSEMRLLLKQGHPMTVSFVVGAGFKSPDAHGYVNSLADPIEDSAGNIGRHITQVVGFVSNAAIQSHPTLAAGIKQNSSGSGGGYFIIKNSWGQCGGDNGYYYVSVNWAKEFFTAVIAFDINPNSDFKQVPNISPTLSITAPNTGLSFPFREKITLKASSSDPDSSTPPSITWSSDLDGLLGTGAQLEVSFGFPGTRKIMAVASDANNGYSLAEYVTITGVNKAPVASIGQPLSSNTIYQGIPVSLQGEALDNDTASGFPAALPCSSLEWTSSKDGALGAGCDLETTFNTLGLRTLTLTATDANGADDTATVVVNVQAVPTQGPPIVNILKPTQNQSLNPSSNAYLSYSAVDPDGSKTLTLQWLIRYSSGSQVIEKVVKPQTGRQLYFVPEEYVPFNCGGRAAELVLKVTDPQGETGTDRVSVYVAYPPC